MPSDVILDGDDVRIATSQLKLTNEAGGAQQSVAVNLGNGAGFWHLSGPRAEPDTPFSIYWWNAAVKQWSQPFLSIFTNGRVRLWNGKGKGLTVDPDGKVGIGTDTPRTPLHVHGSEVLSTGPTAGYSFSDREVGAESGETVDQRWVWYAHDKSARLWAGTDKLKVRADGTVEIGNATIGKDSITLGNVTINDQTIVLSHTVHDAPFKGPIGPGGTPIDVDVSVLVKTDVLAAITDLQDRVTKLEATLASLTPSSPTT